METIFRSNRTLLFTIALASLIILTSIAGLFFGNLYYQESPNSVAQCIGQDIIDLAVIVPTLIISAFFMRKGIRPALFVWLGVTMYAIYTFAIYCFAVHFNAFFLVYCATLGVSVYATVTTIVAIDFSALKSWFDGDSSTRVASTFLFVLALVFCLLWLKEIIPAMIHNEVPPAIKEGGLLTNPVHVLDLSLVLPGFIITSILLRRKHPFGYLFVPAFLVFGALMNGTIGALIVIMKLKGLTADLMLTGVFAVLTLITIVIFFGLVKDMARASGLERSVL
jgi:hypothetical protein